MKASQIQPLADMVLVRRKKPEDRTKGGIYLPDNAQEKKTARGEVLAVGTGKRAKDGVIVPITVKNGDVVMFSKYAGHDIEVDDGDYCLMHAEDIVAVVQES